jgi:succinylglutamate desuccinylase
VAGLMNVPLDSNGGIALPPVHQGIPAGLLEVDARDLHTILPGPTLLRIPGRRRNPLFVSILLHGNETVGLEAIQQVLKRHAGRELPRELVVFVGNVSAAKAGLRHLDGQPDYNRVWPGSPLPRSPETALMQAVTAWCRGLDLFAAIDLHNNTGLNPHYACVAALDATSLQLASLFSRTVVHFRTPPGVLTAAFAAFVPSITCECGKTGDAAGATRAADLVEAYLHLDAIPSHAVAEGDVHLFHTVATVRVRPDVSMSFDGSAADLSFVADLDHFNFQELQEGTLLAQTAHRDALITVDEHGLHRSDEFFDVRNGTLLLRRACMPAMLTRDQRVIRQDCLCYLMERMPLPR